MELVLKHNRELHGCYRELAKILSRMQPGNNRVNNHYDGTFLIASLQLAIINYYLGI